jgi:hypothetical protein
MRILLDGVPFGVPDLHFDSHANIIVTNANLQAWRWMHAQNRANRRLRLLFGGPRASCEIGGSLFAPLFPGEPNKPHRLLEDMGIYPQPICF